MRKKFVQNRTKGVILYSNQCRLEKTHRVADNLITSAIKKKKIQNRCVGHNELDQRNSKTASHRGREY